MERVAINGGKNDLLVCWLLRFWFRRRNGNFKGEDTSPLSRGFDGFSLLLIFEGRPSRAARSALLSVASQQFANHPPSPPSPLTISKIAPCTIGPTKRKWRQTMSGNAVLENVRRYRIIASLYRQTAAFRPDQKWSLLAQAFEYERLARTELERYFNVCDTASRWEMAVAA